MQSFGLDPELVIVRDGLPVSALKTLDATPQRPLSLGASDIYADNVLAELRIPAAQDAFTLEYNIQNAFRGAHNHLSPMRLDARASEVFPAEEMDHPASYTFGCRPEFDAWNLDDGVPTVVETPFLEPGDNLRTCGGHIHIGMSISHGDIPMYIRAMDLMVGIPAVLLNHDPTSIRRHRLYGGAGRFRVTDYGFEYRTLSNFWVARPDLVRIMFALSLMATGLQLPSVPADVVPAINNQDPEMAMHIYETCVMNYLGDGLRRSVRLAIDTPLSTDVFSNWGVG